MGLISFIRINLVTDKNDVRTAILRTRVWHATVRMADVGNDCSVDRSFEFCVYVFPFFIFGNFLSWLANSAHADNTQILILQLLSTHTVYQTFSTTSGFQVCTFLCWLIWYSCKWWSTISDYRRLWNLWGTNGVTEVLK